MRPHAGRSPHTARRCSRCNPAAAAATLRARRLQPCICISTTCTSSMVHVSGARAAHAADEASGGGARCQAVHGPHDAAAASGCGGGDARPRGAFDPSPRGVAPRAPHRAPQRRQPATAEAAGADAAHSSRRAEPHEACGRLTARYAAHRPHRNRTVLEAATARAGGPCPCGRGCTPDGEGCSRMGRSLHPMCAYGCAPPIPSHPTCHDA